jgi:hypothetical protein
MLQSTSRLALLLISDYDVPVYAECAAPDMLRIHVARGFLQADKHMQSMALQRYDQSSAADIVFSID